jgi:hypothetical protein
MTIKLTILTSDVEVMGHELIYKNDLWYVRTSADRNIIPLYEFKCDKNLTLFLDDGLFSKTDAQQAG